MAVFDRLVSAWNAFRYSKEVQLNDPGSYNSGPSASVMPFTPRLRFSSERTIVSSIYTRIGMDVAGVDVRHVKLDAKGRYSEDIEGPLNNCFVFEANLDQSPRAFRQDIITTLFDKGVAAIVPVDTTKDSQTGQTIDIYTLRVGYITQWYKNSVRVSVYNDQTGLREEIVLEKSLVAIVENPLYGVMNEPNSTLQRLIRKLNLLDAVDEQSSSGKLDLIIQLPYTIKSEARRNQAEARKKDIEFQLKGSQYGIAYTDATEKITQLNRPAENNLLDQVTYLTEMLYSQLGITDAVMNGTAPENVMNNYHTRTIEPLLDAVTQAMQRAFLGLSGFTASERIKYFRNPFKFIALADLAVIADKFSRNEILSSNEIRDFMGIVPSDDPKADLLNNSNMPDNPDPTDTQTQ